MCLPKSFNCGSAAVTFWLRLVTINRQILWLPEFNVSISAIESFMESLVKA